MMTDERLEFLRQAAHPDYTRGEFLGEAIDEIDRLRAEVAYLAPRAALYVTPVEYIVHFGDDD